MFSKQTYFDLGIAEKINSISEIYEIWSIVRKFLSNDALSEDEKKLCVLFCKVCSPYLEKVGERVIYKPFLAYPDGTCSFIPEDLTKEELDFLDALVDDIQNQTLKARIADVIWYLKFGPNKITRARQVVDAWLSFDVTVDNFISVWEEIERAISIARSIKYNPNGVQSLKERLFKIVEETPYKNVEIPFRIHLLLIDTIVLTKAEEEFFLKSALGKIKAADGTEGYWSTDIGYLNLIQSCLKKIGDKERAFQNLLAIAQRYEREAVSNDAASEFIKSNYFYELAIKAYLDIPKSRRSEYAIDEKISELKSKKQVAGVASTETLQEFTYEIKIPDEAISQAISRVSNKNFPDVLFYYKSLLKGFPNLGEIEKQAEKNIQDSLLYHLGGRSSINSMGRTTSKEDPVNFGNPEIPDSAKIEAYENYLKFFIPILWESLNVINNEHHITLADLIELSAHSSFVPRVRRIAWAVGLHHGFSGDFCTAGHLLIPQIEHLVRLKLIEAGINTVVSDHNGVENEKSLSTLLDYPEMDTLLDKPFVFELKALFGAAPNMNLRNIVAHGLVDDGGFDYRFFYLWVFALRMVLDSIPIGSSQNDNA